MFLVVARMAGTADMGGMWCWFAMLRGAILGRCGGVSTFGRGGGRAVKGPIGTVLAARSS